MYSSTCRLSSALPSSVTSAAIDRPALLEHARLVEHRLHLGPDLFYCGLARSLVFIELAYKLRVLFLFQSPLPRRLEQTRFVLIEAQFRQPVQVSPRLQFGKVPAHRVLNVTDCRHGQAAVFDVPFL
jgi:hypothetical protein